MFGLSPDKMQLCIFCTKCGNQPRSAPKCPEHSPDPDRASRTAPPSVPKSTPAGRGGDRLKTAKNVAPPCTRWPSTSSCPPCPKARCTAKSTSKGAEGHERTLHPLQTDKLTILSKNSVLLSCGLLQFGALVRFYAARIHLDHFSGATRHPLLAVA